jgi:PAS domain S-box-containing protein
MRHAPQPGSSEMFPAKGATKGSAAPPMARIIALCLAIVAVLWAALLFDINQSETSAIRQACGAGLTLVIVALIWFLARETGRRRQRELSAVVAEEAGRQRMLLDTALNNMRHGLLMFDRAGRAVVINQSYVEMYGLSPVATKPGCTIRELLAQRAANGTFEGHVDDYIETHFVQDQVTDKVFGLPDGRSIRVVNRFMDNGGWVSVHEDVTDHMRAEEERDRNGAFLDRIIDNISVAIQVKNARTLRYMLVNKASEELWGLPRDQMIGRTPHEIFDKEFADAIEEHDRQLLATKSNFYVPEHKIETPRNGTRMVTSNRIAVRDNNGEVQYLVGVVEDVTERKSVEDQLRQAQKMEAIGNLTGGVAHDFNNLLTVILGNLDFLHEDLAGNAAAEEKIKVIMDAAERGADLTRHMLAFSRRQPLQAKPVNVNALIETTIRLLNRTLGENISVEVRTAPDLPLALVDPSQLETALLNIAINARDAMPNGGTLTISTRVVELDEAYTKQHPGVSPGTYAAVELIDSGTGMPPELLERIFEPFFTTKAAGRGTGLGLSMVYGFIKQSGGHINAYSEVGRGTAFKLYLPLASPAVAEQAIESVAPHATKPAGHEVILAVEDNPDIRATVVRQLRDLGYRVREADNAEAALRILDAEEPIDLLFTDMIMPGELNGKELAVKARRKRADLKVLFTSGFLGPSNSHGAQLEAGDVLLSKPYHKRDLEKAVEQALSMPA